MNDPDEGAYDELRALLREARVSEPIPDAVSDRLEETLASLHAEQHVVPLRRRWAPRLTTVAAAVVVLVVGGLGITEIVTSAGEDDDGVATSADAGAGVSGDTSSPETAEPAAPHAVDGSVAEVADELSSATFARDVARLMRTLDRSSAGDTADLEDATSAAPPVTTAPYARRPAASESEAACTEPGVGGAVTLTARLDGAPVTLVFRPPTASGQLVEAWACDGTTALVSATVPR